MSTGPIALFDKSFLQSLSVDESVFFDNFFTTNICPLFYVETLADLEKPVREGRTREQEVEIIAEKFPEHGTPNTNHTDLCIGNLLGHEVPMVGTIMVSGGKFVKSDGESGIVFPTSKESDAFFRWQKGEFLEVERHYAKAWRFALSSLDLKTVAKVFKTFGIDGKTCKSVEEAKTLAEQFVIRRNNPPERMKMILAFLKIPYNYYPSIWKRWCDSGFQPLVEFAPYAAHVLTVEMFFQIALAADLISSERPSNRVDIGYMYYLPFCTVFISTDHLHKKCVPLFLRDNQTLIWGNDLKKGLSELNNHYSHFPDEIKEKGISFFASYPPEKGDFFVSKIWDQFSTKWRNRENITLSDSKIDGKSLSEKIIKMNEAPSLTTQEIDFDPLNPDTVTLNRSIRKKKGSWYQLPKDLKEKE